MKLFTKREVTTTFNTKQSIDIGQIAYLETTLASLQNRINIENTQFEKRLKELKEVYGGEKTKLQEEVKVLQGELKILSDERVRLLVPFGNLKDQAKELLADAQLKILSLEVKEQEVEEILIKYQNKIDSLSTRETDIETKEQSLSIKLESAQKEAEQISEGHIRLNKLIKETDSKIYTQSKELAEKESAILLREQSFQRTKETIEKQLAEEKRALTDKRETLDRGFNELKRLQNKLINK